MRCTIRKGRRGHPKKIFKEVAVQDVPGTRLNAADREYADEQFSVSEDIMPYSQRDNASNTDANHAYLSQNE